MRDPWIPPQGNCCWYPAIPGWFITTGGIIVLPHGLGGAQACLESDFASAFGGAAGGGCGEDGGVGGRGFAGGNFKFRWPLLSIRNCRMTIQ